MKDIVKWTIPVEASLQIEAKHLSIDQQQPINEFAKPAIDAFRSKLVEMIQQIKTDTARQLEEQRLAKQYPIEVSGNPVEPITEILEQPITN